MIKQFLNENKIKRVDSDELLKKLYNTLGNIIHSDVPENESV